MPTLWTFGNVAWCERQGLKLFSVRRTDIELYARWLEGAGRARATVARRLCTVAGFYRYAEEEGLVLVSPAVHVRRPRLDYEPHAVGLDRNEVGALLVAAGLGAPVEHALMSVVALNGLRVSEAIGADIEALGLERGHRTLTVLRKDGKMVTVVILGAGFRPRRPAWCWEGWRGIAESAFLDEMVRSVIRCAPANRRSGLGAASQPWVYRDRESLMTRLHRRPCRYAERRRS